MPAVVPTSRAGAIVWAPAGAADQDALANGVRLHVHHVVAIGGDGRRRHQGWDGYWNGQYVSRWHSEKAAKHALERRALARRH